MIGFSVVTLVAPLCTLWSYRRSGRRFAVLAVLFALAGSFVTVFYVYGFQIEAGLCGQTSGWALALAVPVYLIVASWAATRPSRVWAWFLAVVAAGAAYLLVAYFFDAAHVYCET